MIAEIKKRLFVLDSTPKGDALLMENQSLRDAIGVWASAEEPQKARISGIELLGMGRFSFTFAFRNELALKLSGPRTNRESREKKRGCPSEDLSAQFNILSELRRYGRLAKYNITVPEQYFVSLSPINNYILGQELMQGWESIADRTEREYHLRQLAEPEVVKKEVAVWTSRIYARVVNAIEGFRYLRRLNDLVKEDEKSIHPGNVLIPIGAELDGKMPLCIIDQPKEKQVL